MENEEIKSAKEFLLDKFGNTNDIELLEKVSETLIEFTKLHVQKALKEASIKVKTKTTLSKKSRAGYSSSSSFESIDKNSIINSYPLKNIK